jgi:hypothetical protein
MRHVAHMGWMRNWYNAKFRYGILQGRDHSEDLSVVGRVMLKRIFRSWGRRTWTGFILLQIWSSGGIL